MNDYDQLLEQAKSISFMTIDRSVRIINNLPDALILVNRTGIVKFANERTGLMFDYNLSDLIGQPFDILIPEDIRERHKVHFQKYFNDPRSRPMGIDLQLTGKTRDGRLIPVEINLSPFTDPEGVLVQAVIRQTRVRNG
jgi:rsbT co-antagonist protein RsbR